MVCLVLLLFVSVNFFANHVSSRGKFTQTHLVFLVPSKKFDSCLFDPFVVSRRREKRTERIQTYRLDFVQFGTCFVYFIRLCSCRCFLSLDFFCCNQDFCFTPPPSPLFNVSSYLIVSLNRVSADRLSCTCLLINCELLIQGSITCYTRLMRLFIDACLIDYLIGRWSICERPLSQLMVDWFINKDVQQCFRMISTYPTNRVAVDFLASILVLGLLRNYF